MSTGGAPFGRPRRGLPPGRPLYRESDSIVRGAAGSRAEMSPARRDDTRVDGTGAGPYAGRGPTSPHVERASLDARLGAEPPSAV